METFDGYKKAYSWLVQNRYAAPNRRKPLGTTKFYTDVKKGRFPVENQEAITKDELLAYVHRACLVRLDGNASRLDDLLEKEKQTKIELMEIRKQREKFNAEKEAGQYIHRAKWLIELVSKLSAAKHTAVLVARTKAPDLIAAVNGDLRKTSVFIELYESWLDDAFDDLANVPELHFVVKK